MLKYIHSGYNLTVCLSFESGQKEDRKADTKAGRPKEQRWD